MSCSRGQGLRELYGIVVSDLGFILCLGGKDLFFSSLFADILPLLQDNLCEIPFSAPPSWSKYTF